MQSRKLYLLDTCIYGILVDKEHEEYGAVQRILDYAKRHREQFVTTFIIHSEFLDMKLEHQNIVLPKYYRTLSKTLPPLEVSLSEQDTDIEKLSWKYIQKLKIKNAEKTIYDALNYALSSYAGIGVFVTLNRRDILAKEFQPTIKRINEEIQVKYIEIKTPTQFLDFLAPLI